MENIASADDAVALVLRILPFFMLVTMPASAKSRDNATSAAAIRGDFMKLIFALQPRNLEKGRDSVEFVPRAEVIGMPHAAACHGQIVSRIWRSVVGPPVRSDVFLSDSLSHTQRGSSMRKVKCRSILVI